MMACGISAVAYVKCVGMLKLQLKQGIEPTTILNQLLGILVENGFDCL